MRVKNGDGSYDTLHPVTKAKNVFFSSGGSIEDKLSVEEGTWTPVLEGATVRGNHRYKEQLGWYARTGNKVTLDFSITLSKLDLKMNGQVNIKGLPFKPDGRRFNGACSLGRWYGFSSSTNSTYLGFAIVSGVLRGYLGGLSKSGPSLLVTNMSDSSTIQGTVTYKISEV